MPRAYVFINTKTGSPTVIEDLQKVEGVREAHPSQGMYDAVAMVQADSFNQVRDIIAKQIRNIDNVKSTLTLTLIEKQQGN
jgi:DNA-binding Lrp family transcriptional regulator